MCVCVCVCVEGGQSRLELHPLSCGFSAIDTCSYPSCGCENIARVCGVGTCSQEYVPVFSFLRTGSVNT